MDKINNITQQQKLQQNVLKKPVDFVAKCIQPNLSIADTYWTEEKCPLFTGVRYTEERVKFGKNVFMIRISSVDKALDEQLKKCLK